MTKLLEFFKKHPIIKHLLLVALATVIFFWLVMLFLDWWTFHGQTRIVPDVKSLPYNVAEANIRHADLRPVISDSIFDTTHHPGAVVEQTPRAHAKIKPGGSVYLTIVAFSPKMVTVPDFYNVSLRQARSIFEGLGITHITVEEVPSEYKNLVLGAKFNGLPLRPGAQLPVTASIVLEVGAGVEPEVEQDSLDMIIDDTFDNSPELLIDD